MGKECGLQVLLQEGGVRLEGGITPKKVHAIMEALAFLSIQNISSVMFFINSGGGGVDPGLDLYDLLKRSQKKMIGIVDERCSSMAAIVLQGCAVRKAHHDAYILIHDIFPGKGVDASNDGLLENRKRKQEKIYRILAERTGRSIEEVVKKCKEDEKMSAKEALEFGLIDEII